MACFSPLHGWRAKSANPTGKRSIVFDRGAAHIDQPVELPCGVCPGCRLEKSRQWAMRCVHEASLYEDNCFVTLTYDDDNLPPGNSLEKHALQRFMKRLRKRYEPRKIRFFGAGEYGDDTGRPHYHLCLFNLAFHDQELYRPGENPLYVSPALGDIWKAGFHTIGALTFESAAYTARYVMKKQLGKDKKPYYGLDERTGELREIEPEFAIMSRRPGLGKKYFETYADELKRHDSVIVNGHEVGMPKYYDSLLPEPVLETAKGKRRRAAAKYKADQSSERLRVREKVTLARLNLKSGAKI